MQDTFAVCAHCQKLNRVDFKQSLAKTPVCGACRSELPVKNGIFEASGSGLMTLVQHSPIPVIADFWAPWCAPCRAFEPVYKQAAKAMAGKAVFAKVDIQAHPMAADLYIVRGVPTLIAFQSGIEIRRQSGVMPLEHFLRWADVSIGKAAA